MDDGIADERELQRTLAELGIINRRLGGHAASRSVLDPLVAGSGRPLTVLDVGAGGGDLLRELAASWSRRGRAVRVVGLDLCARSCRFARRGMDAAFGRQGGAGREPAALFLAGDGFRLPFPDHSVDVAHSAMMMHHFRDEEIARLLVEMRRVSRAGVLVNDLHRNALAHGGIRLLTAFFSRSRFIRHDAPLSVRRGFRREELRTLWRSAGMNGTTIRWRWAFRYVLWTPAEGGEGTS
jgi:ubiquinone/menaquinone biosynthesis C-methylase UbiE